MATVYKNKQLVYLSIIFFFYFSSIGCLAPFFTAHMRHLGFSLTEVSFINSVSAFISILGPIIFGSIAERHSKYKTITVICIFIGALVFSALTFVPRSERLHYKPLVDFSCQSGLRIEKCVNWATCSEAVDADNLTTIKLTDCRYQCRRGEQVSTAYPIHVCFHGKHGNICVVYDADAGNMSATEFQTQLSSWPYDEKKEDYNYNSTVIQHKNANHDFFDLAWLDLSRNGEPDQLKANVAMCNYHPLGAISFNHKPYNSITCKPTFQDCGIHCRATFLSGGSPNTPKLCEEASGNPSTTFWAYLVLRCVGDLCFLTVVCLLDALIVSCTSDFEGAYGRMHIWPALGLAAFPPFSGALLDHYSDMEGKADFSMPSFVSAGLAVLTCALIIALPVRGKRYSAQFQSLGRDNKLQQEHGIRTNKKSLTFELFAFFIIVILLGMEWGVMFTFLPWLTMDIGCSGMMTGLGYTLVFGCCLPFLLISKNMVRNIGRANLLVFSFLFYGTRYAGVSFVFSPWWTLPFASMGAFTLCVMWIAVVAYGQSLAPLGYNLIMQYVLNILHFAVGRGIGSLLGGTIISHHGQRVMFRGVAVFSASIGFLFLALYHCAIKKKPNGKNEPFTTSSNGNAWYPLREHRPNGQAKSHNSIFADIDDDSDLVAD